MHVVTIRAATNKDWEQLRPLLEHMGSLAGGVAAQSRFARLITSDEHLLLVADAAGELVGYAWVHDYGPHLRSGDSLARLNDLYIDPRHRRQGFGRALFEHVRSWAMARGVRYLQWQASRDAIPFYSRLGLTGDPCPDPQHPEFEIDLSGSWLDPL